MKSLLKLLLLAVVAAGAVGCAEKGPAEKTGQAIDRAGEKARDTIDPPGTAEKVGRTIDRNTPGK